MARIGDGPSLAGKMGGRGGKAASQEIGDPAPARRAGPLRGRRWEIGGAGRLGLGLGLGLGKFGKRKELRRR